jgi:exoribonuclease-2
MLDPNALNQLAQLKENIENSKERLTGVVRAGNGRFGFAACGLPDGTTKDVFISPEEMQKVLPGDIVNLLVVDADKGKKAGLIEGLKHSDFEECFGIYRIKGNNHFVQVDQGRWSRWLFVPPAQRAPKADHGCMDGSYVKAALKRHPYPDGKAQVAIICNFGTADSAGVEARFNTARLSLPQQWSDSAIAEADAFIRRNDDGIARTDLSALPFVTIDSANTLDMDDALYGETHENGFRVWVAIADPDVYVPAESELDKQAQLRASSIYLPGGGIPMLPPALSQHACSLVPDVEHKALVCRLDLNSHGELLEHQFQLATICSVAKLAYDDVAVALDSGEMNFAEAVNTSLKCLHSALTARIEWRRQYALLGQERPDYAISLDNNKKVCAIRKMSRNSAQRLVEEAMLTTNQCAASDLANAGRGIFSIHPGFRPEQLAEVKSILEQHLPECLDLDLSDESSYKKILDLIETRALEAPVQGLLQRRLIPGSFSDTPKSHFGLALPHYATITSPIRRYADLVNLRHIKALLSDKSNEQDLAKIASHINQQMSLIRQASNNTEHWMKVDWLREQNIGNSINATIINFRHTGISVRLEDWGIMASIDLRKAKRGYNFESKTGIAKLGDLTLSIDSQVPVLIEKIDPTSREVNVKLAI